MDRTRAALVLERLLSVGLAVTTQRTEAGYTCEITGVALTQLPGSVPRS